MRPATPTNDGIAGGEGLFGSAQIGGNLRAQLPNPHVVRVAFDELFQ